MLARVEQLVVTDPPSSKGVEERALESLGKGGLLHLIYKQVQEVPQPQEIDMDIRIRHTSHPAEGGMIISGVPVEDGRELEDSSLIVRTEADVTLRASASLVRAKQS